MGQLVMNQYQKLLKCSHSGLKPLSKYLVIISKKPVFFYLIREVLNLNWFHGTMPFTVQTVLYPQTVHKTPANTCRLRVSYHHNFQLPYSISLIHPVKQGCFQICLTQLQSLPLLIDQTYLKKFEAADGSS